MGGGEGGIGFESRVVGFVGFEANADEERVASEFALGVLSGAPNPIDCYMSRQLKFSAKVFEARLSDLSLSLPHVHRSRQTDARLKERS